MSLINRFKSTLHKPLLWGGLACLVGLTPLLSTIPTEGFTYTGWSGWSETRPADVWGRQIDSATHYKYRDKEYTNHTAASLSGWTQTGEKWDQLSSWVFEKSHAMDGLLYDQCRKYDDSWGNLVAGATGNHYLWWRTTSVSGYWYNRAVSDAGWNMFAGNAQTHCGVGGLTHKYEAASPTVAYRLQVWETASYTRTLTPFWKFWRWKNGGAYTWSESYVASSADREVVPTTRYRYRDVADTTAPTGSCWLSNKTGSGYRITCDVYEENSGIKQVRFPTWTVTNGQDDIKWVTGTYSNSTTNDDGVYSYVQVYRDFTRAEWNNQLDYYNTHIYAMDNKGNERSIGGFNNIDLRDATPPTTSFVKNPNLTWTNQDSSVKIVATDNTGGTGIKTVQYSLDNSTWHTVSNNHTLNFTSPGTYTVYARSSDYSDNWSSTVSTTVKIDKTNPTITSAVVSPSGWTNQAINITSNGSDSGGSGFYRYLYRNNQAGNTWTGVNGTAFSYNVPLVDGVHTIQIKGVDHAGNESATQTVYAYYDSTAPTLSISQEITNLTTKFYNLNATASDATSTVDRIQLPNGNVVYQSTASYFITQNGTYTFKTWDKAGNFTTQSITVSNIQPIQDGMNSGLHSAYQTTGAVNSNGWLTLGETGKVAINGEGETLLTAEGRDEAGNKSPQQSTSIKIDQTPPTLTATHNTEWTNQAVNVSVTAKDQVGLLSLNGFKNRLNTNDRLGTQNVNAQASVALIYLNSNQTTLDPLASLETTLKSLGLNVIVLSDSEFLAGAYTNYDVYFLQGGGFSIPPQVLNKLSQLQAAKKMVISCGNDSGAEHPFIDGAKVSPHSTYELEGSQDGHFLSDLVLKQTLTDGHWQVTQLAPNVKVLGHLKYPDSTTSPAILWNAHKYGGQWIHFQTNYEGIGENLFTKTIVWLSQQRMSPTKTLTQAFTVNDNGDYYFSAYDVAGNRQTLHYRVGNIDRNSPKININVSPSTWTNQDVLVDIYASDAESGVQSLEYELIGATIKSITSLNQSHVQFTISNTGVTTIRARATDKAGNQSAWISDNAYVDKVKPYEVTLTANPTLTNQPNILLKLVTRDADSGVAFKRFKRNDEEWRTWSTYQIDEAALTIPVIEEGVNTFYAQSRDLAGNVSDVVSAQVVYDISGPTITSAIVNPYYTNFDKVQVVIQAQDNFEAEGFTTVDRIQLSNDGNNWVSFPVVGGELIVNEWQIPLVNGYQNIYVQAFDSLGNASDIKTVTYLVDTIAPTGSIVIEKGEIYVPDEVTLTLRYDDILNSIKGLSGVAKLEIFDVNANYSHTIENPEGDQMTVPWVLTSYQASDGLYKATVGLKIWDKAGNLTTVYSQEVVLMRIQVEDFYLTDVVHPDVYHPQNPFVPLRYPNIPSQPLLRLGSFSFEAHYSYPKVIPPGWTLDVEINITYVSPTGVETVRRHLKSNVVIDGLVDFREIIPEDKVDGTDVFLDLRFVFKNGSETIEAGIFPRVAGTKLKIGTLDGDIRDFVRFNEIY